ncbi:Iron multicopper oxidase fer1 [Vanrija pseudolonga]|uniref:Iron multicopper oxidase fer1 n=1 Tax=Vanrija pseudolonga TaxID=143232 RepID=A0AAF1BQ83_9TREE|nr:Iron multicopper oxidase fer1 [Vanrija pseudolonga]
MVAKALLAALPLVGLAQAAVIEHWWNITYVDNVNPDGLFPRRVIGVNGSWPPPPLWSNHGDKIIVHATNGLGVDSIPTALHAHGMIFNGTNYYDGAVGITQCGIPNGYTLDYEIDTVHNQGTYWIHGHYSGQYVDGLRAPNIILPANGTGRTDNVTWDDEYVIIASDWYHRQHDDMVKNEFLNWRNPTGAEPVPESALIYIAKDGKYLHTNQEISSGVGNNDNATITFEPGKTYRIRVIAMTALTMFHFGIEDHDMQIIEIDGTEIVPYPIDTIAISAAQRYSILVTAKNQTDKNYAMMFMQDPEMYDKVPDDLVLNNTVQIVYNSANEAPKPVIYESWAMINETDMHPMIQQASFQPDVQFTLHAVFDTFDDGTNRASWSLDDGFQNSTFQSPKVPTIFSALSMGEDATQHQVYGAQTNAIPLKHGDVVELKVHNWDSGHHPFHLHGHTFQVIEKSFDVTSDDPVINPQIVDDQKNPIHRDTITIPPGGMVVLRFIADNPGAWFFHCHIDWHLTSGLAVVFIEAPDVMQKTLTVPQQMYDHCKFFKQATSGNVVGLNSTTDFKGQPWGPFPLKMNWTPKAIGAMAGCILTAIIGFLTVVWYGTGELNEEEIEEEVRRHVEAKQHKKPLWKKLTGSRTE